MDSDLLDLLEEGFVDCALVLLEVHIFCSDIKLVKALGDHDLGLHGVEILLEDNDVS